MEQVVVAQMTVFEVVVELEEKTVRVPEEAAGIVRVIVESLMIRKCEGEDFEVPEVEFVDPPATV